MKITKKGSTIGSVDEWLSLAPPKGGQGHWKDGRSAKELAKAWFPAVARICIPSEFSALLKSSRFLDDVRLCRGEPEVLVSFDSFKGGVRNCDLLVLGVCQRGKLVISVEAKADERFDSSVGGKFAIGERTEGSKLPERIRHLTSAVLGKSVEECRELRYQLLQGTAAALSAAAKHEAAIAIFVVHEFVTECTGDANHQKNAEDLNRFVSALSGVANQQVHDRILLGPFRVPGNAYIPSSVQLLIGKATRNTRPNRPNE